MTKDLRKAVEADELSVPATSQSLRSDPNLEVAIRLHLRQEKACQGEHGINKEGRNAKSAERSDVWIFRLRETSTDGKSEYRKAIVGTVDTLANEASALKAAQALRINANQQTPQADAGPRTIALLVAH